MLLQELNWPLGAPLEGKYVKDLRPCDHIVTFPYSKSLLTKDHSFTCHTSLALPEPRAIHRLYYFLLPLIRRKYFRVFTRYKKLDTANNNIVAIPLARSAISPTVQGRPTALRKPISLIASNKKKTKGHKLRHVLIERIRSLKIQIDVLGRGYQPYEQDHEGLLPYRYSVVIENAQEDNYFTEKVIDCLICRTVPIYWGCRDISTYFDTSNWLIVSEPKDAIEAITLAQGRVPDEALIEKNYQQAKEYLDPDKRCADYLSDTKGC